MAEDFELKNVGIVAVIIGVVVFLLAMAGVFVTLYT
jgi:hypothetical protein